MRHLGLLRRSAERSADDLRERRWTLRAATHGSVAQRLAVLHDQLARPSCVGQAHSQGIESITGHRVSAVGLWEGARILQGDAGVAGAGTRGEYVVDWMSRHGWADYVPGEDARPGRLDTDSRPDDTLAAMMSAHGRSCRTVMQHAIDHRQHADGIVTQLVAALNRSDHYVVLEGGTTDRLLNPPANTVLDASYRGGHLGGHAERVVGWDASRNAAIIQGSWGSWTWCHLPDGARATGCYLLAAGALREAWAIDVVEVRT